MRISLEELSQNNWELETPDLVETHPAYRQFLKKTRTEYSFLLSKFPSFEQRPYQPEFAAMYATRRLNICNGSMGVGKTIIAILTLMAVYDNLSDRRPGTIQIVADSIFACQYAWLVDFQRFGLNHLVQIISSEAELKSSRAPIWIYHRDFPKRKCKALKGRRHCRLSHYIKRHCPPSFFIIDEVHNCVGKSDRAKHIDNVASSAKRILAITGTASDGDLERIYLLLKLVYRSAISFNKNSIKRSYGTLQPVRSNYRTGEEGEFVPDEDTRYLPTIAVQALPQYAKFIRQYIHRSSLKDPNIAPCCSYPDKEETDYRIPLTEAHQEMYQAAMNFSLPHLKEIAAYSSHVNSFSKAQGLINSLVTVSSNTWQLSFDKVQPSKQQKLFELVEAQLERERKVVVFTDIVNAGNMLEKKLRERFGSYGDVVRIYAADPHAHPKNLSKAERLNRFDRLMYDPTAVIGMLNIRFLSTSVNMPSVGCGIFWDLPWRAVFVDQAIERFHRPGSMFSEVQVAFLNHISTVDEHQHYLLKARRRGRDLIQDYQVRSATQDLSFNALSTAKLIAKEYESSHG